MSRLRVAYNKFFRRLMGISHWNAELERVESMTQLYMEKGVRSFPELILYSSFSCIERVMDSENLLVHCLKMSDAQIYSRQWRHWENLCDQHI